MSTCNLRQLSRKGASSSSIYSGLTERLGNYKCETGDEYLMAERKKQHYVPKLYMRGFTDNEKLPSYQLDHRQEFQPTSIHNLCYEDYFYDKEGDTEDAMSDLEGKFASVLQDIWVTESFSAVDSTEDWMFLLIFLTHTHSRTKTAKVESRETSTDMLQIFLEAHEGVMEGDDEKMRQKAIEQINEGKLRVEDSSAFPMQELVSMHGPFLIGDLKPVLLKDSTDRQFIFSDHPVALDNPMYKDRVDLATVGFQSPGLQLFCPISSDLAVMMFDPACYDLPDEDVIEIGSDTVAELNKLQLVNALDAVFYEETGREPEIQILHDEIEEYREESMNQVRRFDEDDPRFDTENEIVSFSRAAPDFSPDLPFVEQRDADFAPVRSPDMYQMFRERIDKTLEEGKEWQQAEEME